MPTDRSATPAWIWVTTGCLAAIVLLVTVIAGLGYYGFRKAREFRETMEDPVIRSRAAREILGAESLPDGYHAVAAFSVPLLMETVVLSDRPGVPEDEAELFYQHGFLYTSSRSFGDQERQIEDFFEGRTDEADFLSRTTVSLRRRELVARGAIEEPGRTLEWIAHRGDGLGRRPGARRPELFSTVLVDCPDDDRLRMGIWLGPDPDPEAPLEQVDLAGTVADAEEIRRFFSGFDLCG